MQVNPSITFQFDHSLIKFEALDATSTIHRDINTSKETGLITAQERASISNILWRRSTTHWHSSHESLFVLGLS